MEIRMVWSKSTKNTEVYVAAYEDTEVTQIYIQKSAFKNEAPTEIILTIEEI